MPEQARQQAPVQPSLPKEPPRSAQPGPTVPSVTIDEARQRALDAILKVRSSLGAAFSGARIACVMLITSITNS